MKSLIKFSALFVITIILGVIIVTLFPPKIAADVQCGGVPCYLMGPECAIQVECCLGTYCSPLYFRKVYSGEEGSCSKCYISYACVEGCIY